MKTILGLDIGAEFVKAAIARPDRHGNLVVLGAGKALQSRSSIRNGAITDIPAVIASCEEAIGLAERWADERADVTVVGITGELVESNTTTVKYLRPQPNRPIAEAEIQDILKKVQQKSSEIAKQTIMLETGNRETEVSLINSAIVSMSIDGYKVNNPIGFKGKEVSILIYTAFAPKIQIAAIEKVCAELNLDLLTVAVGPFAACRACLGNNNDGLEAGIIVDIGGGTTDIAIVEDGSIKGTKMFSIGGQNFTRQIEEQLGIDFMTAENYKLKLDSGELDDAMKGRIEAAIRRSLAVWLTGAEVSIEEIQIEGDLPRQVLLCGGGANLSLLQETLAMSDWYKKLPFSRRPIVHLIDINEALPNFSISEGVMIGTDFVTTLGLLRVGIDTLISAPEENKIRARISRLLQN